ncbi:MAG: NAD(P)-dependent oxidoreductase [Candidatus Omnitrophota bacterium]
MNTSIIKINKVGITGASGNIGTTLRKGLGKDYDLSLYDSRKSSLITESKFIKADLAQKNEIDGIFNGLDALIHLAGNPHPNAPRQQTLQNNFLATSLVFEEARRAGVRKIVYASSNFYHEAAIGEALQGTLGGLITLDMPPSPVCLYGESKVYGENLGRHLSYSGMQFVALRIGWTVPQDNPKAYGGDYMRAVFCSHRDLVQAFGKALEINTSFLAAFAVSDNARPVFDLAETKKKLGFIPQDNAENYF